MPLLCISHPSGLISVFFFQGFCFALPCFGFVLFFFFFDPCLFVCFCCGILISSLLGIFCYIPEPGSGILSSQIEQNLVSVPR